MKVHVVWRLAKPSYHNGAVVYGVYGEKDDAIKAWKALPAEERGGIQGFEVQSWHGLEKGNQDEMRIDIDREIQKDIEYIKKIERNSSVFDSPDVGAGEVIKFLIRLYFESKRYGLMIEKYPSLLETKQ